MSIASVYAKALHQAACEGRSPQESARLCDMLESQLDGFVNAINASKEAKMALTGPLTNAQEKASLLEAITKKTGSEDLLRRFLILMAKKNRLGLLARVREEFIAARLAAEGGVSGRLVSADPLAAEDIEDLAKSFGRQLGKKVAFRVATDPSLLAGIKVTVNGVTYDGSLRSQLHRLRDQLLTGVSNG